MLRVEAQPSGVDGTSPATIAVVQVRVLPDLAYSWDQIRIDTTLAFRQADSLQPAQARRFWLKIKVINRSGYTDAAQLTLLPNLDNTLFYFDEDARAWQARRAGVAVGTDSKQTKGRLPLRLPGHAAATFYVQVNLPTSDALPRAIPLRLKLEPAEAAQKTEQLSDVAWAVSLAVLVVLLLTNLLAYVRFRDRITLYYCWSQVGAMFYITAFRITLPTPIFSLLVTPTGLSYSYTLHNVLMHLSVLLLLLGVVQMTRDYLLTQARLPRLDAGLRYALWGYCAFTVVVAVVNVSGFYLNYYTLRYDNLLVLGVVGLVLTTTVVAYRQRLPSARTYLLANMLPLLFMLLMAGYHVMFGSDNDNTVLLPNLAIVSHALSFAAALSIRLQNLQRTLLDKEREADHLTLDIEQQKLRHREIVLKNTHIQTALGQLEQQQQAREQHTQQLSADNEQHQATNQDLQAQLEANQRELASTTLYVTQKNALLAELKQQIEELNTQSPNKQRELSGIKSILQTNLYLDDDWTRFKLHFEQVHPRFFEELQEQYPALTKNEQRLYCYFHINLATKEIAALLNIDPASVRRAKTRLFKKIAAADVAAGRTPVEQAPAEPQADE
jgi:DNA-binding CsgD family transcriptional regulator